MKGKVLTYVSLVWVMISAVMFTTRFVYWDFFFHDQENPLITGIGHVVSEIQEGMNWALIILAVGIALWISQKQK